ncbi:hypothetical protein ACFQ71_03000 [Streptomyces sp. NPDC056534]|uniref:hypothetical protein n=1 Tax=Streptomyces sp. NPDC056534 TaxID=3345857 RepID=UPI0036B122C0
MARNLFGGTTADVAEDVSGARIPGAVGTVWDGPSDGARQVLDLMDADGAPIIQLVADNRGFLPTFYGPDNGAERLWADFGNGKIGLVSVTAGERLAAHATAVDPHQDRAYTEERLNAFIPRTGAVLQVDKGTTWSSFNVADLAGISGDSVGNVFKVENSTGTPAGHKEFSRLKATGALYLDPIGSHIPLVIGQWEAVNDNGTALTIARGRAGTEPYVFKVRSDGRVEASGNVTAPNVGSARLFSGPTAPASPKAGDCWVQYG